RRATASAKATAGAGSRKARAVCTPGRPSARGPQTPTGTQTIAGHVHVHVNVHGHGPRPKADHVRTRYSVAMSPPALPDGLVAVVKSDCPTCRLVGPVLDDLARRAPLTVVSEDEDPGLALSYTMHIQTVPTLLRVAGGVEVARTEGWSRADWERLASVGPLGAA